MNISNRALGVLLLSAAVEAFMVPSSSSNVAVRNNVMNAPIAPSFTLYATEGEEASEESTEGEAAETELVSEEEEEEKKEDPEVTALKDEIASLEKKLSEKRLEKNTLDRLIDNYSEGGYARKVAEMENVRKMRSLAFIDNKFTAKASIVQSFLPVMDALAAADNTYADSDNNKYTALSGNMRTALKELDVEEYTVEVGSIVDKRRVSISEEVYSDQYEKDVVISPVSVGLELKGNVIRLAECVVSLGSEAAAAAEEEAAGETGEEASSEEEAFE